MLDGPGSHIMASAAIRWATMPGREVTCKQLHIVIQYNASARDRACGKSQNLVEGKTQLRMCGSTDFFTSGINLRLPVAIGVMVALYMFSYFFWGLIWLFVYWCATPDYAVLLLLQKCALLV